MIPISSSRSNTPSNIDPSPLSRSRSDNSHETLTASSNNGIRPRNRRLDSTRREQELVNTGAAGATSRSRAVSPIPERHPSRGTSSNGVHEQSSTGLLAATQNPMSLSGLGWDGTWASSRFQAFQEIAFSMLGGAQEEDTAGGGSLRKPPAKKEGWFARGKTPSVWGPDTGLPKKSGQGIGAGSSEARDEEMKARRRARLLEGRDEGSSIMDTNGNYKRRTSTEEQRSGNNHEDDHALVYVHHVQPNDTVQGVVLRYHCQMDIFKKANRFWGGDSIQTRKTVYLPVDACAIKGRPCEPPTPNSPHGVDLLAPTPSLEESPFPDNNTWITSSNRKSAELPEDENPYMHVRWVLIDSSPSSNPVEIVRIARKILNYFPPRRRKSLATLSTVSTPRASVEFPRMLQSTSNEPSSSTASTPSRRTSNLGPRPHQITAIGSYFPPPSLTLPHNGPRRESVGESTDRLGWLRGPGGVGTLGKNVRKPGPGKDALNTWTKKHIPGLAIDSLPSTSITGAESAHIGFDNNELSGSVEGTVKIENGNGSQGIAFPNLNMTPSAVESWVRKIATKAALPGTPRGGARPSEPVLIEMLDGTGSDDGRGFELDPGSVRSGTPLGGTGRENVDGLIRGRGGKSGKND